MHRRSPGKQAQEGRRGLYDVIREQASQGRLSIEEMCQLGRVSRTGYYERWKLSKPREEETALRSRLQELALSHQYYGYRRLGALLRREGWQVNHKRVLRLMRSDNLLCLRRRGFHVLTTDSRHAWQVWPNLARWIKTTGINQLWVADITYIRLDEEFVYLAVVLDAHSRCVVGWALERRLDTMLPLRALTMALQSRRPEPGMIHHSDRGVQYACGDYVAMLQKHGMQISMSRVGNPYDNAKAESFMKTLKQEEIYGSAYRDLEQLRQSIGDFLEDYYNRRRLHSALGYQSPVEFEQRLDTIGCGESGRLPPSPTPPTPAGTCYPVPNFLVLP